MGSVHTAACQCGFTSDVTVGGGRRSFRENSKFPFYCACCGLVAVNVAPLSDSQTDVECPTCRSQRAIQYGVRPVSEHDLIRDRKRFWQFWKKAEAVLTDGALEWGNRKAALKGHTCPACKAMTLEFSRYPNILFD
jgi:hypothetical protein